MKWQLGRLPRLILALAVVAEAGLAASQASAACRIGIVADLPVTMIGQRASVPIKVNGKDTNFWLDSGAFFNIMSKAKATELDLTTTPLPQGFYVIGVGGSASVEVTTIKSFGIVGQDIKNMQFMVGGSDAGNGLIGRNLLGLVDTEFDLAHGTVKVIKPHDCGNQAMTYWAPGKPYFEAELLPDEAPVDHDFRVPVNINGVRVTAEFDTGAHGTLLGRRAAERAGINLSGPGVVPFSGINGVGRRFKEGWIVPVGNVAIGDEQILQTHIVVIDGPISGGEGAPEMLLGMDYMLAHHIYVARDRRRVFFTYSGGKPFLTAPTEATSSTATSAPVALPPGTHRVEAIRSTVAEAKTADEFARRGNARLAQHDNSGAVADLTEAIRLSPKSFGYYRDRAKAYGESGQGSLARADIDSALVIEPTNGELLRVRAVMRFLAHDKEGALADVEAAQRATPPASLDAVLVGELFEQLGLPARAIPVYSSIIAVHREDSQLGQLLNARCWVRGLANVELDQALDDCNRAIKRDGPRPAYLDSRGLINYRKNQYAIAIADYDAALKEAPRLAWSLEMRGLAKAALGQIEAGKEDQAAAAAIQPEIAAHAAKYGLGRPEHP